MRVPMICCVLLLLALPAQAAVLYDFVMGTPSGFSFNEARVQANSSGTMIGNYDAVDNPTGTRTKPGLLTTFGPTENVAVPTTVNTLFSGRPAAEMGGSFAALVDPAAGSIAIRDYASASTGTATGAINATATLTTQTFRTRSPDSTIPGGIPIPISLGTGTLQALSIVQLEGPAVGALVAEGPGQYSFSLLLPVQVSGTMQLMGDDTPFGPLLTVLPMSGSILLDGALASLSAVVQMDATEMQAVEIILPTMPLDLPTLAGDAHVLMDLTVTQLNSTFAGLGAVVAEGAVVPEPAAALLVLAAGLGACRRGRRR
jgi:hypothetical protein